MSVSFDIFLSGKVWFIFHLYLIQSLYVNWWTAVLCWGFFGLVINIQYCNWSESSVLLYSSYSQNTFLPCALLLVLWQWSHSAVQLHLHLCCRTYEAGIRVITVQRAAGCLPVLWRSSVNNAEADGASVDMMHSLAPNSSQHQHDHCAQMLIKTVLCDTSCCKQQYGQQS